MKLTRNERGNAMIVILGCTAVTTCLALGVTTLAQRRAIDHGETVRAMLRSSVILQVRREVRAAYHVWSSLAVLSNGPLRNCVLAEASEPSWNCDSNVTSPVTFLDETGVRITGDSPASAVYYNPQGDVSTAGNPDAIYRVYTTFKPTCPNGWTACSLAKDLLVVMHFESLTKAGWSTEHIPQIVPIVEWGLGQWQINAYDATLHRDGSNLGDPTAGPAAADPADPGPSGPSAPAGPAPAAYEPLVPIENTACGPGQTIDLSNPTNPCRTFAF